MMWRTCIGMFPLLWSVASYQELTPCRMFGPCILWCLRAWLHGEFQPGLKFRSAHRAEILLRLHAQFQPGRKTQISVRKFTEVRKHNRYACSRSFFSDGWKNDSVYMGRDTFNQNSNRSDREKRTTSKGGPVFSGWTEPTHWVLDRSFRKFWLNGSRSWIFQPGLNPSPCNRQLGFQRICFRSRAEISAQDETHHVIGP